jgi:crotonobetainyl-CoA:carnitine CoA-transferase CaiB-like acyl-CoA transferase
MSGACEGLQVIDFTWWMAGPLATMILADCGAEVIKVEPPAGDPARGLPAFHTWNRGKRSVVADLKTPAGRDRVHALMRNADVVVAAFRPDVAERLGIDYATARALNPAVVYGEITGFGPQGEYSHLKGYEALVAAKSGRMMVYEGIAGRAGPGYSAVPLASFSTAMLTVQGILAALHSRQVTGLGQKVAVSMLASLLPYDMHMWILHQQGSQPDPDNKTGTASRAYDPRQMHRPDFRVPRPSIWAGVTKDGAWLWFENTAHHLCAAQMSALDLLDLYQDERFANLPAVSNEADAEHLWEILLERVREKTYAEWRDILDAYEIGVERVQWPLDVLRHRQVLNNGHTIHLPGADGQRTRQPGPLVRFSESTCGPRFAAPRLGEHSDLSFPDRTSAPDGRPETAREEGPLSDVAILDLSTWYAGAYATSVLANLGARIIKVEPLGGDPGRYLVGGLLGFATSQGKESLAVNLKDPEGIRIVQGLVQRVDALYHNFRTDVAERLGLDYASARRLNARIIYVHASAYGDDGPDRRRPAFMGTVAAATGYALRQVGHGHPLPSSSELEMEELKKEAWRLARTAEGNADVSSALAAATALLLGLQARGAGNSGQSLMTTMICSNMYPNSDEMIDFEGRPAPPRVDEYLQGLSPAYMMYETRDGWAFLSCLRQDEWDTFCRVAGRTDLEGRWRDAWQPLTRSEAARSLAQEIAGTLLGRSAVEWERAMAPRSVPLVQVETRDPGRFALESTLLRDAGHIVRVESDQHGDYWRHGALQLLSRDGGTYGAWEPVGGHSRSILAELGYGDRQVAELITAGVVEASDAAT